MDLQQLREEFEAAIDVVAANWSAHTFDPREMKDPEFFLRDWVLETEFFVPGPEPEEIRAAHLARLYIVARDHGMDATMLWKLQRP